MTVMSSPRAPAASSTGRSLAPVPTSSTGLGTVRTRPAPGSTAGARAPGRSPAWLLAWPVKQWVGEPGGPHPTRTWPLLFLLF